MNDCSTNLCFDRFDQGGQPFTIDGVAADMIDQITPEWPHGTSTIETLIFLSDQLGVATSRHTTHSTANIDIAVISSRNHNATRGGHCQLQIDSGVACLRALDIREAILCGSFSTNERVGCNLDLGRCTHTNETTATAKTAVSVANPDAGARGSVGHGAANRGTARTIGYFEPADVARAVDVRATEEPIRDRQTRRHEPVRHLPAAFHQKLRRCHWAVGCRSEPRPGGRLDDG